MASTVVSTLSPPPFAKGVNMRGYNAVLTLKDIEGFSQYCDKGAIDLVSFSFDIGSDSEGASKGGGLSSSRVSFRGVTIRKSIDRATPLLFNMLAHRKQIENAGIFLFRDPAKGAETAEHFFTISMGEVFVTKQILVDPEGPDAGGVPYEEVTLSANSIEQNHVLAKKVASILLTTGR